MNDSELFHFPDNESISFVRAIPRDKYRLRLNSNFTVEQQTRPNAWWRFWQWALLGWTWEEI